MSPISGVPTVVDYLLAVAALLGAVAWPVVVVALIIAFRKPLRDALAHLIEFRFGSAAVKFDRAAADVGSSLIESLVEAKAKEAQPGDAPTRPDLTVYYAGRAEENPLNAILEAYGTVERWFDQALTSHGIENHEGHRKLDVPQMAELAVQHGLIPRDRLQQLHGLRIMRNLAVHSQGDKTTPEQAREFLVLVEGTLYSLDLELANSAKSTE